MKPLLTALLLLFASVGANAQNCSQTSTGYPPINDLGKGYYRGYQGGLYPNGENYAPDKQTTEALRRTALFGDYATMGTTKTIMISIGMSNTTMESKALQSLLDTFATKNQNLQFIDCAEGGMDVTAILSDTASYWKFVEEQLTKNNVTAREVGVIWFKEAEASPHDTVFPHHADTLIQYYTRILQHIQRLFPNVQLCYLSSRIYAGYATSNLNPEPYAYESGWAVKWLIEHQINGDSDLDYSSSAPTYKPKVPLLLWGPYLWADGTTPRSDGLTWICPDDFNSDGTHPSASGRIKVAKRLLDFFAHDVTTVEWFLSQQGVKEFDLLAPVASSRLPDYHDTMIWRAVPGSVNYVVEIQQSTFEASQGKPYTIRLSDTSLVLDSLPLPQLHYPLYYIKVYALDSLNRVIAITGNREVMYRPWRPKLVSPTDDSTVSSSPVVLKWTATPSWNDQYTLTLASDPLLKSVVHTQSVRSASGFSVDTVTGLQNDTKYFWSVFAPGTDYTEEEWWHPDIWSDTTSFTTGDINSVLSSNSGEYFRLRYSEHPVIDYTASTAQTVHVYSVDVLGRQEQVADCTIGAQAGSLSLPREDRHVLFYLVRSATCEYVLRTIP
jgi:hypothetical protein